MTTQLGLAIEGRLDEVMRRDAAAIEATDAAVVKRRTRAFQLDVRAAVRGAFGGRGGRQVGNAVRSRLYDDGPKGSAGTVYSKFGRGTGAGFVDYLKPFAEGATLRATSGDWLYIPIEGRGRRGVRQRAKIDVADTKNVDFVPADGGRKVYIVRRTARRSTLIAVLVRQVRIRQSIDVDRLVAAEQQAYRREYLAELERNLGL